MPEEEQTFRQDFITFWKTSPHRVFYVSWMFAAVFSPVLGRWLQGKHVSAALLFRSFAWTVSYLLAGSLLIVANARLKRVKAAKDAEDR